MRHLQALEGEVRATRRALRHSHGAAQRAKGEAAALERARSASFCCLIGSFSVIALNSMHQS